MNFDLVSRLLVDASQFDRVLTIAEGRLVGFAAHAAAAGNPASAAVAGAAASVLEGVRRTADLALGAINAVGNATTNLVKESVVAAAKFEQLRTTFETMLGSRLRAENLLGDIEKLAIATPYSSAGLGANARLLLGADTPTEQVVPTLSRLGDIAGGEEGRLSSLVLAYSQAKGIGRLMGGELMQFRNAGLYDKDIADTMGVSVQRFRSLMESGQVGIDVLEKTIERLTSAGGKFFENSEKQSRTLIGRWNSLSETLERVRRRFGEGVLERFSLADNLGKVTEQVDRLVDKYLPDVVAWVGRVADTFKGWLPPVEQVAARAEGWGRYLADLLPPMDAVKTKAEEVAAVLASWGKMAAEFGGDLRRVAAQFAPQDGKGPAPDNPVDQWAWSNVARLPFDMSAPKMVYDAYKARADFTDSLARGRELDAALADSNRAARFVGPPVPNGFVQSDPDNPFKALAGNNPLGLLSVMLATPALTAAGSGTYRPNQLAGQLFDRLFKDFSEGGADPYSRYTLERDRLRDLGMAPGMDQATLDYGRYKNYQQLRQGVGGYFANLDTPAPLAVSGSTQAQDLINKATLASRDREEEVLQTLRAGQQFQAAQKEEQAKTNAILEKIDQGKLVVTRKGT